MHLVASSSLVDHLAVGAVGVVLVAIEYPTSSLMQ